MSTSYQHASGRWTHGKRSIKATLITHLKSEDFGYGTGGEVYEHQGKLFVQKGNMTWEVTRPVNPSDNNNQSSDRETDIVFTS
jgi:hypothetical protein